MTDKPYYIGFVQHDSVMTKKETYEFLAERLAFSEANICATFRALAAALEINAAKGLITFFDKVASVRTVVKGSFANSNGPWVKGRNFLMLNAVELDPFKSMLEGVIPVKHPGMPAALERIFFGGVAQARNRALLADELQHLEQPRTVHAA